MSKTSFFKWQLPFLTLDINVKFNFKTTFIEIVYAYFQPFGRNFCFLIVLFEFLLKNRITVGCKKIEDNQIFYSLIHPSCYQV
jgi:hypothetical protein